jgi:4-diphosphocytidyl-2-C-methyl-D-erythritol kinase
MRASANDVSVLTFESPAKINLLLAITGRRADGFHDLVSVVAPLGWGDTLTVKPANEFSLTCTDSAVPVDSTNLVLRAAEAFRRATGLSLGATFSLEKRIPLGAGLGGGSSNAAIALRALNELSGGVLSLEKLTAVAAEVGSDCALFLHNSPVIMRGRGDLIEPLAAAATKRISGRRVLVFKPAFGISTPWAYAQLAAKAPSGYHPAEKVESQLAAWLDSDRPIEELLVNNMEGPAFAKFPAFPVLLDRLSKIFGLAAHMSGSGSACFAFLHKDSPVDDIIHSIQESWGESAFSLQTHLQ